MRTKRYLLCLFAAFLAILGAVAQEPFKREFSVGFGGGMNFSKVGFTPKVPQGFQPGMQAGVVVRWLTQRNLGLTAEINYSQQGWKEDFSEVENGGQYKYSRTINYVELPFMTHIYGGNDRIRFIFHVGPKIGYYLSDSIDENLNGATPQRVNAQHDLPIKNKLDWGVCGGPGVELRTGIGSFVLEGRFYMALGNLYGNSKKDDFPKSNSSTLSVKLSYLIKIK